jgi:hypothetical protein
MSRWHSLYLLHTQQSEVADAVAEYMGQEGYTRYDPFGNALAPSYPQTLKVFVAPPHGGWTRLLTDCEMTDGESLAIDLSHIAPCLSVNLEGRTGFVHVYQDGNPCSELEPSIMPLCPLENRATLRAAFEAEELALPTLETLQLGDIRIDDLPDFMQDIAQQVNADHAEGLFNKVARQLLRTIARRDATMIFDRYPDWNSQAGQLIRVVLDNVLPEINWRTPDFVIVRTAYNIYTQEQPIILPGDEFALSAVPNALDYQPVYGGKLADEQEA